MRSSDARGVILSPSLGAKASSVFPAERLAESSFRVFDFQESRSSALGHAPVGSAPSPAPNIAQEMMTQAVAKAEKLGYERGLAEARAAQAEALAKLSSRLEGAISSLHGALDRTEEACAKDVLRVALLVGEKLARRAFEVDVDALLASLAATAERTEGPGALEVSCAPASAAELKSRLAELTSTLRVDGLTVREDPRLLPGDLMVSRGSTTVDARIATRLERIEQALFRELGLSLESDPC